MAHRPPIITQPAIARALREAKKQGCELIEINCLSILNPIVLVMENALESAEPMEHKSLLINTKVHLPNCKA